MQSLFDSRGIGEVSSELSYHFPRETSQNFLQNYCFLPVEYLPLYVGRYVRWSGLKGSLSSGGIIVSYDYSFVKIKTNIGGIIQVKMSTSKFGLKMTDYEIAVLSLHETSL